MIGVLIALEFSGVTVTGTDKAPLLTATISTGVNIGVIGFGVGAPVELATTASGKCTAAMIYPGTGIAGIASGVIAVGTATAPLDTGVVITGVATVAGDSGFGAAIII